MFITLNKTLAVRKRNWVNHPRLESEISNGYENACEVFQNYKTTRNDLRLFSYASILEATDNFSLENKLGEGGYGPVYKVYI